jgi:sugar O-acyltransferase (sialic acid O-acetyltransferase NeuD family)
MKPIVLWGASGHAMVLNEFLAGLGYELVALFDNDPRVTTPFPGVPLHIGREGFQQWLQRTAAEPRAERKAACLVAIGGARGRERLEIQAFLAANGLQAAIAVHPRAFVASDAALGAGCQVLANATVAARARLEESVIVNTAASVDHEARIARGVHIGPGAVLAGCVTVGEFTLIGTGAVVLPRIRIGNNVVIGAGAVVTRDVPDGMLSYGNPARVVRKNNTGQAR